MDFFSVCPYVRYVGIMPGIMEGVTVRRAFDCRLFYILEGSAILFANEITFSLEPGTIIYLPAGLPYNIEGNVKMIVLNFDLTGNAFGLKPKTPKPSNLFREEEIFDHTCPPNELKNPLYCPNAKEMEPIFQECLSLKAGQSKNADLILSGLVKLLLGKLEGRRNGLPIESETGLAQSVMLYIQQNYDKNLNNEILSKTFGYHPYHLNRIFKKAFGITIHQTVLRERIRIAKHLLKHTNLTVERITSIIGFSDRVAFYQSFRKHTGESPAQYRLHRTSV